MIPLPNELKSAPLAFLKVNKLGYVSSTGWLM